MFWAGFTSIFRSSVVNIGMMLNMFIGSGVRGSRSNVDSSILKYPRYFVGKAWSCAILISISMSSFWEHHLVNVTVKSASSLVSMSSEFR